MSKRKPLPYAAGQLVDTARMSLSDALRSIRPLISSQPLTGEEQMRRLAQTIYHITQANDCLQRINEIQNQTE
jgi:hypothetical protein